MNIIDLVRRKRQRIEGPGVPVLPAVPVVPRPAPPFEVVDVEAEPDTASPSHVPPVTEPTGVPSPSPMIEAAGAENAGKGKEPLGQGGIPLVIFPEPRKDGDDEEYQRLVKYHEARLLEGEEAKRAIH